MGATCKRPVLLPRPSAVYAAAVAAAKLIISAIPDPMELKIQHKTYYN
jgi:hypothetical protein